MQAIILDKSYLEGASRTAIQELMGRRTLVMCSALFYELLDTSAKQRTRCFAKLPAIDNPLMLVDHVGELMRIEVQTRLPSGLPSMHALAVRFRFNPVLLTEAYQLPTEAREAMQDKQRWRRKSEHGDEWKLGPLIGPGERGRKEPRA